MPYRLSRACVAAALLLLVMFGFAIADDPPASPPPNTGAISFTATFNFPTSYYFRGIAQSNAGFMFQPYAEIKGTVYEGDEKAFLSNAYVKVAGFAHFQSVEPPITNNYYEQDLYLTAGAVLMKRLTLETGWNLYAYPSGISSQVQEVFGKVAFDDGGLWPFKLPKDQDFSLAPYLLFAGETSGQADGAQPYGGHRGIYFEMGIDPGYSVDFTSAWSARVHLPFTLGLSLKDYYEVATSTGISSKAFGYANLGLMVDVPLKFMPPKYGKWTLTAGPQFLWLGTNNKLIAGPPSANALNGLNVTGGKGFQVSGLAGLKLEY